MRPRHVPIKEDPAPVFSSSLPRYFLNSNGSSSCARVKPTTASPSTKVSGLNRYPLNKRDPVAGSSQRGLGAQHCVAGAQASRGLCRPRGPWMRGLEVAKRDATESRRVATLGSLSRGGVLLLPKRRCRPGSEGFPDGPNPALLFTCYWLPVSATLLVTG